MSRQYVMKKFLAVVPSDLLREYLKHCGIDNGIEWNLVCPNNLDAVIQAITAASKEIQKKINADFREINDMSDSSGVLTLIDVSKSLHPDMNLAQELVDIKNVQRKVFWVFLHYPDVFHLANRVDDFRDSRAFPIDDMPALPDDWDSQASKGRIRESISNFFQYHEGRGEGCEIEYNVIDGKHYWFVFLENYTNVKPGFDDSHTLGLQTYRPVFNVSYRYDENVRVLEISGFGRKDRIDELKGIFTRAVFGMDLYGVGNNKVFHLKHLLDPAFEPEPQLDLGIASCKLKKVKVNAHGRTGLTMTLESGEHYSRQAILDCVTSFLSTATISMGDVHVCSATLQVMFVPEPGKRKGRPRTFTVYRQGSTTLDNDPRSDIVKECLKRWGIDANRTDGSRSAQPSSVAQTVIHER